MSYVNMELPEKQTKLFTISPLFAKEENVPTIFVGIVLKQTAKAAYLYGRGTREAQTKFNRCCKCGAKLSHPGSIILGIGPECLKNWGARDQIKDSMTQEQINDVIGKLLVNQSIDRWVPKGLIKQVNDSAETIQPPADHKMLNSGNGSAKTRQATLHGKTIRIDFPFDRELITNVKTLSGRSYHGDDPRDRHWSCPLNIDSAEKLREWGFALDDELTAFLNNSKLNVNDIDKTRLPDIPGLQMSLYPFQRQGVEFIERRNGRALIGDEMGLGKTCQSIAWTRLRHADCRPVLIVCPASLKLNWKQEIKMWLGDGVQISVLSGTKPDVAALYYCDYVIINYDILHAWEEIITAEYKPRTMIVDECHYIKSSKAKRTKTVRKLAKRVEHVIMLSGTPIVNRPEEGYNAIKLIDSTIIGSWFDYAKRYCNAYHDGFGWNTKGASNTQELHKKLTNTIMLRRLKADVLTDLPPKRRSIVPLEISNEKEYRRVEHDFIEWVREMKGDEAASHANNAEALAKIEALKQVCIKGKMKQIIEWVENFIESNGKLIVFCTHRATVKTLATHFGTSAVRYEGGMSSIQKDSAKTQFQTDDSVRLFIGNMKAAGVGITLTAASTTAFIELGWTPGDHDQAEDRVHRIGQEAESVMAYYLIADNTIEKDIMQLLDRKRKVLSQVLDGTAPDEMSLLTELLDQIRRASANENTYHA